MFNYFLTIEMFLKRVKSYLELMVGQVLVDSVDEQLAAVSHYDLIRYT